MSLETLIVILVAIVILAIILIAVFQLGLLSIFGTKEVVEGKANRPSKDYGHLIDKEAVVRTDLDPEGMVFVFGELWKARSSAGVIRQGATVRVVDAKGMLLIVEPVDAR